MSDIGLPLWSSPHLNLIDADGLVDKHIADAPSVRTQLTRELIAREVRNDIADRPLTAETRRWIRAETERLYRDAVVQQNARRIMEEVRPEYILVFEIHPSEVTAEPGQRYPDLIDRVTRHANFEDYVLQQSWRKLDGNVWNHLYRRSDVSVGLSPEERAERLAVLIERNPRVRIFQFMDAAGRTMIGGDR